MIIRYTKHAILDFKKKGSEKMDASPESQIRGFNPKYENIIQYTGAFTGRCPFCINIGGLS